MSTASVTAPTKKLLLVDDDRLVLATMASGLADAGFTVSAAESAEEAEDLLAGGPRPDLAILDVRMPGAGGLELAARLREFDHVPFMMLTAYSDPEIVERAAQCGALGYAVKPLNMNQLIPAVEAALARAEELYHLRASRTQLQRALDQDRDISIAVGITMMQYRVGRAAAFELLRKAARSRQKKLGVLAAEVIGGCEALAS